MKNFWVPSIKYHFIAIFLLVIASPLNSKHMIVGEFAEENLEECYAAINFGEKISEDHDREITFSTYYLFQGSVYIFSLNRVNMGHQSYKRLTCKRFVPSQWQPNIDHVESNG